MSADIHGTLNDEFELERIAVGPYCLLDNFRLSPSPQPSRSSILAPPTSLAMMEDPIMTSNYPFATMRQPWMHPQQDDISAWNEWMQFDPTDHAQSSAAQANPAHQPPSTHYTRRQQSLSQPLQPTSIQSSAPGYAQVNNVPFTFEQNAALSAAFDFSATDLTSPLSAHPSQHSSFFPQPDWQQQQPLQQTADDTLFSPESYPQSTLIAAPPLPTTATSSRDNSTSLKHERHSSPSSHSSPEPIAPSKKRKSRSEYDESEAGPSTRRTGGPPPKKTAHNMIEKRYRTNLNDKIAALRDSVPSLRVMSRPNGLEEDDDPEDLEGLTPAHKLNKATVLSKATEYIRHLEKRLKRIEDEKSILLDEKKALEARLTGFDNVVPPPGSVGLSSSHVGTPDGPFNHVHAMSIHRPVQGMIPVPENIAALQQRLPHQQHYAHAYSQYSNTARQTTGSPMVNGRRGNTMMGKVMVGSLAGLMVLEGFAGNEQSQGTPNDRGLFALPLNLAGLLAPRALLGASVGRIPLAKLLLITCALFYLVVPFFENKKRLKKNGPLAIRLAAVPSLASPVEVRRKAWLTAIQTVWVPDTTFMLEIAALGLKTIKLTMRKLIGWPVYSLITGISKDQEAARIKAWEIALNAQFTGGDAQIDKSRLLLTLLASGTLPDTPARLMHKALHIRVLLWEIARPDHDPWWILDDLSAKMARSYWNMARSEHFIALNVASKQGTVAKPLPKHLAALIEKGCDEVLVPAIVQRVYNLAWNRSSAENTFVEPSMDSVVEDSAICSPLDALAAWYSSLALRKGLASALATKKSSLKASIVSTLDLALQVAPPNSQAYIRALAAHAVLLKGDRAVRIKLVLDALPVVPSSSPGGFINLVGDCSVAVDVRQALTLAKCLTLLDSTSPVARQRAISVINTTCLPEHTTTLLSFVAGHRILARCMQDVSLQEETTRGLEGLASSLRMWVGHDIGKQSGLSNKVRSKIVEGCLDASKTLVGLAEQKGDTEIDDGYVSSSVKDD